MEDGNSILVEITGIGCMLRAYAVIMPNKIEYAAKAGNHFIIWKGRRHIIK